MAQYFMAVPVPWLPCGRTVVPRRVESSIHAVLDHDQESSVVSLALASLASP